MAATNERKAVALESTAKAIEEANMLELFTAKVDDSNPVVSEFFRLRREQVLKTMSQ